MSVWHREFGIRAFQVCRAGVRAAPLLIATSCLLGNSHAHAAEASTAPSEQSTGGPVSTPSVSPEVESVTVIGSRGIARTDVDRPAPVDIVDARDLRDTGQTDLGQQVQFTSPSFNSAKYGVNGTTNYYLSAAFSFL